MNTLNERFLDTWGENWPDSYEFEYFVSCGECRQPPPVIITVTGDEVVDIHNIGEFDTPIPDYLRVTIDDLLDEVGLRCDPSRRLRSEH